MMRSFYSPIILRLNNQNHSSINVFLHDVRLFLVLGRLLGCFPISNIYEETLTFKFISIPFLYSVVITFILSSLYIARVMYETNNAYYKTVFTIWQVVGIPSYWLGIKRCLRFTDVWIKFQTKYTNLFGTTVKTNVRKSSVICSVIVSMILFLGIFISVSFNYILGRHEWYSIISVPSTTIDMLTGAWFYIVSLFFQDTYKCFIVDTNRLLSVTNRGHTIPGHNIEKIRILVLHLDYMINNIGNIFLHRHLLQIIAFVFSTIFNTYYGLLYIGDVYSFYLLSVSCLNLLLLSYGTSIAESVNDAVRPVCFLLYTP